MIKRNPFLLCILDGVGLRDAEYGNAWKCANTPFLDTLITKHPHSELKTHGLAVGLPQGQMGNSEVGHMTIGAGRVIAQNLERIEKQLRSTEFEDSFAWYESKQQLKNARAIHLIAMISDGGVHSHTQHVIEMARLLDALDRPVLIHAITDGRDTAPSCAQQQIDHLMRQVSIFSNVQIVDVCGRFYAMDRDRRWDRTEKAYRLYTEREGDTYNNWHKAIERAHARGETDEFIAPSWLTEVDGNDPRIMDGDAIVFGNFRADRMRQITRAFTDLEVGFERRKTPKLKAIITMTAYDKWFNDKVHVLFNDETPANTIGEVIANNNLRQLRIAESEKYAHVTYFLNGGRETPFDNEERMVIPSPKVKTYDLQPQMNLDELTERTVSAINNGGYDLIVLNIANGDMVGHSGNFEAATQAMEHVDHALKQICDALREKHGQGIITADHGNIEDMFDGNGDAVTSHSTNPVPCIYLGKNKVKLQNGSLADIAPTVLKLMGIKIPQEMSGKCLIS